MEVSIEVILCCIIISYIVNYYYDVKNKILKKYKNFRDVNKLVNTQYKNIGMILWVSCNMIAKMYWINFLQYINNSVEHVDSKNSIISYVLNGKMYKFTTKIKKGPVDILLIIDEDSNDVSDRILPFFGPNQDWHGRKFTPSFWDKKSLTFELGSDSSKIFLEDEAITLD